MAAKKNRVQFVKSILVPHFNAERQPRGLGKVIRPCFKRAGLGPYAGGLGRVFEIRSPVVVNSKC